MTINEIKLKKKESELQINKILQTLADETDCHVDFIFNYEDVYSSSNNIKYKKQLFTCKIEVKIWVSMS